MDTAQQAHPRNTDRKLQIQKNPEDQAEGTVDLRRAGINWIQQSLGRVSGREF